MAHPLIFDAISLILSDRGKREWNLHRRGTPAVHLKTLKRIRRRDGSLGPYRVVAKRFYDGGKAYVGGYAQKPVLTDAIRLAMETALDLRPAHDLF